MNSYALFLIAVVSIFALVLILIISLFLWNYQLSKNLKIKTREIETEHQRTTKIVEILTHDMGNLLHTVYNLSILSAMKEGSFENNESLLLLEESIFKIKFTRQLITLLSRGLYKKTFVNLHEFIKELTSHYLLTHYTKQSPDIIFPEGSADLCIVKDENLDILFEYLMFQSLLQQQKNSEIIIIYSKEQNMLDFVFKINLYDKFKLVETLGKREKVKSIEQDFIEHCVKGLGGLIVYSKDKFIIKLPYIKMPYFKR